MKAEIIYVHDQTGVCTGDQLASGDGRPANPFRTNNIKIKVRQLKHVFTVDCITPLPYFPHHFLSLH